MKRSSTIFLQIVVVLMGIGTLVLMLWEPQLEGRNVNAPLFQIYFTDPFLAYAYTGSIAFFVALYQVFKLLGYVRRNAVFSQPTVKALRTIKYCAITLIGFIAGAEGYIIIWMPGKEDDIAGGVAMGLLLMFISVVIVTVAVVLEKRQRGKLLLTNQ